MTLARLDFLFEKQMVKVFQLLVVKDICNISFDSLGMTVTNLLKYLSLNNKYVFYAIWRAID